MALVVKSNIKKYVDLNVGEDLATELEKQVKEMLRKAEERARANNRKTVYARDV